MHQSNEEDPVLALQDTEMYQQYRRHEVNLALQRVRHRQWEDEHSLGKLANKAMRAEKIVLMVIMLTAVGVCFMFSLSSVLKDMTPKFHELTPRLRAKSHVHMLDVRSRFNPYTFHVHEVVAMPLLDSARWVSQRIPAIPALASLQRYGVNVDRFEGANYYAQRHLLALEDVPDLPATEAPTASDGEWLVGKMLHVEPDQIARFDRNLNSVPERFDPENTRYWESLVMMFVPCIVIGVVAYYCGCYIVCYRACGCCGGVTPKEGGYTRNERWVPKIILLVILGVVFLGALIGLIGNGKLSESITAYFDIVLATSERIRTTISNINDKFRQFENISQGLTTEITDVIDELEEGILEVEEQIIDVRSRVKGYDSYRKAALGVAFGCALVAVALGLLGILFNHKLLLYFMCFFALISLLVMWTTFGIHLPISELIKDLCRAIDEYLRNPTGEAAEAVNAVLECDTSNFLEGLDVVNQTIEETLNTLNDVVNDTVGYQGYTMDNISSLNTSAFPIDVKQQLDALVSNIRVAQSILPDLRNLFDCDLVRGTLQRLKDNMCNDMRQALEMIAWGSALIAIALLPGFIVGLIGAKRFPNSEDAWAEKNVTFSGSPYSGAPPAAVGFGGGAAGGYEMNNATPPPPPDYGSGGAVDLPPPPYSDGTEKGGGESMFGGGEQSLDEIPVEDEQQAKGYD